MPPVLTKATSNAEGEDLGSPLEVKDLKTADVVLYQFDASPPCWKIRALLHWYEIPYRSVTAYPGSKIDGLDNTYHKIPKLVIDGTQINDSAVVFRTLAPILTDAPLTESQTELEKRNNISGLLGALEKETVSSYFGIVSAARTLTNGWNSWSYMPLKPFLPYAAGFLAPLGLLAFRNMPHGKDGDSLEHGRAYRDALGKSAFFHGEQVAIQSPFIQQPHADTKPQAVTAPRLVAQPDPSLSSIPSDWAARPLPVWHVRLLHQGAGRAAGPRRARQVRPARVVRALRRGGERHPAGGWRAAEPGGHRRVEGAVDLRERYQMCVIDAGTMKGDRVFWMCGREANFLSPSP